MYIKWNYFSKYSLVIILICFSIYGKSVVCSPLIAGKEGRVGFVCYPCDNANSKNDHTTISLDTYDFEQTGVGAFSVVFGNSIWHSRTIANRAASLKTGRLPPVASTRTDFPRIKFRQGKFWQISDSGDRVSKWNENSGKWELALLLTRPFNSFEISFTGDIVMISGPRGASENNMIEIYPPNSAKCVSKIPFPATNLGLDAEHIFPIVWDLPISTVYREHVLIYFPMCGRLFCYNFVNSAFKEMKTPWKAISGEKIKKEAKETGIIRINTFPGIRCLQFLPSEIAKARVAYQFPRIVKSMSGNPNSSTTLPAPLPPEVQIGILDFKENTLKWNLNIKLPYLPVWQGDNGVWVPLKDALTSKLKKSP